MSIEKCRKCGGRLSKKGVLDSGNTKYQIWSCKECGADNAEVFVTKNRTNHPLKI